MGPQRVLRGGPFENQQVAWGRSHATGPLGACGRRVMGRCAGGPVFRVAGVWHHSRAHYDLCTPRSDAVHARRALKLGPWGVGDLRGRGVWCRPVCGHDDPPDHHGAHGGRRRSHAGRYADSREEEHINVYGLGVDVSIHHVYAPEEQTHGHSSVRIIICDAMVGSAARGYQ
jgi:hypothetical protein